MGVVAKPAPRDRVVPSWRIPFRPYPIVSRDHRPAVSVRATDALVAAAITSGILLVVYGLTLAPDLTWANDSQDGGELITAAVTLGVPHPPGYPTYVVLGRLFSLLPVGTIAFRLNLMSAVTVALAAGLVAAWLSARRSGRTGMAVAVAGGVTLGLLPPIWGQATVAEVYGLALLFVAAFAVCVSTTGRSGAAGLFLGLAITAHLSSVLLLPLAIVLTPRRQWGKLAAGTAVGLTPLLLLPFLVASGSPVMWGAPQTLGGWWWLVSARLYAANLGWPSATSLVRPYLWMAPVLMLLGVAVPAVLSRRGGHPTRWDWAFGLTIVGYGIFALAYGTSDAYVVLLSALLLAVMLLFGRVPLPPAVALAIPAVLLLTGFSQQNLRHDTAVRPLAEAVLQAAPANAIILTPGDRTIFTLWYFHHAEGQRTDLIMVDENLFAFDWYRAQLGGRYPALWGLEQDDLARFRVLNGAAAPICAAALVSPPAQPLLSGYTYRLGANGYAPFLACQELIP